MLKTRASEAGALEVAALAIIQGHNEAAIEIRDVMQFEGELHHHAKHGAGTAHGLKQVGVMCAIGCHLRRVHCTCVGIVIRRGRGPGRGGTACHHCVVR